MSVDTQLLSVAETAPDAYADVPVELTERTQWVVWRLELRRTRSDPDGKLTKVSYSPRTGRQASTNHSSTWGTFDDTLQALRRDHYDGIGFVFSASDPYAGVDFDDCRDPARGTVADWAQGYITRLSSYTEVSPSGAGFHIIVRGKLPPQGRKKGDVEMYDASRFFTITGRRLAGTPRTIERRDAELTVLHEQVFGRGADDGAAQRQPQRARGSASLSDTALIDRAKNAKNGAAFSRLWEGDVAGYASASEADLALCSMLAFWTRGDQVRTDRLFRQSGLFRPKWDEVHGSDGHTYGQMTIAKALRRGAASVRAQATPDAPGEGPGRDVKEPADAASPLPLPTSQQLPEEPLSSLHYSATASGLAWLKLSRDGAVPVLLTNFIARIVADVAEDDGAEVRRAFEIEASLKDRTRRFVVPADRFTGMGWAAEHLGAGAIVYPGSTIKDHARAAVQFLSGEVPERHIYTHIGWRQLDTGWAFLHAGGAIGADGPVAGVDVVLPDALSRYRLPPPPPQEDLGAAVTASLRILDLAPDVTTAPLYAAIWRAALGECDFSLHLSGPTGQGKSELAALIQQHYGAEMHARALPSNWASTGNALEALAFQAKDAVFVVDDFAPHGGQANIQQYHRDADRLLRAQGNHAGRQRMRADATLRPAKSPRGLILSTGEDVPRGQSLRSRLLLLEHAPGTLDWEALGPCQRDAAAALYGQAMAGYLRWLAGQYETIRLGLRERIEELRQQATTSTMHKRTPAIIANLAVGMRSFLGYAEETGALSAGESAALWQRVWSALGRVAAAQASHQTATEPTQRFLDLLAAAIGCGDAHVADKHGRAPETPEAWGWRATTSRVSAAQRDDWHPQGMRVGWVDGDALYVEPEAAYGVAQSMAQRGGDTLAVTLPTLRKRLHEARWLASVDQARQTLTIRRHLEGRQRNVLHLRPKCLSADAPPDKPDIQDNLRRQSPNRTHGASEPGAPMSAAPENLTHIKAAARPALTGPLAADVGSVGLMEVREAPRTNCYPAEPPALASSSDERPEPDIGPDNEPDRPQGAERGEWTA